MTTPTPPPPLPPTDREEEEGAAERGALGEAVVQGSRRHPKFAVKGEVGGVGGGEGEAAPDFFIWRRGRCHPPHVAFVLFFYSHAYS